eukprot:g34177.t1
MAEQIQIFYYGKEGKATLEEREGKQEKDLGEKEGCVTRRRELVPGQFRLGCVSWVPRYNGANSKNLPRDKHDNTWESEQAIR